MRMRRVLAWLCVLCCISSSLFSVAFAVDTLEDMDIDPWGDLELIQQIPEPTSSPVIQDPFEFEPEGEWHNPVYSILPGETAYSIGSQAVGPFVFYTSSDGVTFSTEGKPITLESADPITHSALISSAGVRLSVNGTVVNYKSRYFGWSFAPNAALRITQAREIPADTYMSVTLNGSIFAETLVYFSQDGSYNHNGYPDYVQFCVNGVGVGPIFNHTSDGIFDFSGVSIDLSSYAGSAIQTVGFLFSFDSTHTSAPYRVYHWSSTGSGKSSALRFRFDDANLNLSWSKDGSGSSGSSAEQDQARHEETKGLLNSIIGWLSSLLDAIINLPANIASAVGDLLRMLFVPGEEELQGMKAKYETLLSERLGFIWQAGDWITDFGSELLAAVTGGGEAEFVFPGVGFDMNGEHYQLIEEQAIDLESNGIVTVIRPYVGTIVALVVVIACVNLFHDMVAALISGKSYFDFLK